VVVVVVVFLCLAALYESWSISVAVLLAVPLGLLGMAAFCQLFHVPNDIYFKIGMVTMMAGSQERDSDRRVRGCRAGAA
jgi:multidrug efflux pump